MKIGLLAVDSEYPNLALIKISRYHKSRGDEVEWYTPFGSYDKVYMSKIFTFTPDYPYYINNAREVVRGGTGYDMHLHCPPEIDRLQPDYSLYGVSDDTAYGFLTRGCPNACKWCVVPEKEGKIHPYMDIEEVTEGWKRNKVVLMDNNILASDYGIGQLEKIADHGIHIDLNQAIDARLVNEDNAKILARVKWLKYVRFGCDTTRQIPACERAAELMTKYGYRGEFFLYCILIDFKESFLRVNHWRQMRKFVPFAQPYRDFRKAETEIPQWQKDMARWCNRRWLYRSMEFKDFSPRKGFRCDMYFTDIQ